MLDRTRFINMMTGLAEMYKQNLSEFMLDMYFSLLKDYTEKQVSEAIRKVMANYKYNTLPKPADILEYLEGTRDDKALMAWLQAKEAVQKGGYYASVVFKDPIIAHCIKELGGWQNFCCCPVKELSFLEKRFLDLYRVLEKRGLCDNLRLIGFTELQNGERGFLDKIPEPIMIGFEQKELENKKVETTCT